VRVTRVGRIVYTSFHFVALRRNPTNYPKGQLSQRRVL
jgi:hypothetical protein